MRIFNLHRSLVAAPVVLALALAAAGLGGPGADGATEASAAALVAGAGRLAPSAPVTSTYTATPDAIGTAVAGTMTALAPPATNTPPPRTGTPLPTLPPRPVLLPVTLRDPACRPEASYSDVVFVQDVSKYMLKVHDGKESRAWATQYMRQMVSLVDLSHARVGLVRFTNNAWVEQGLTNSPSLLLAALDKQPQYARDAARMDLGLRIARDQLQNWGTPRNRKAVIFISELQAKSVPWENVPGCVEQRGVECAVLAVADELKGQGVTLYVWATSKANDGGEMLWASLATDTSKRYLLPKESDIVKTHGELEQVKACPPELFWPRSSHSALGMVPPQRPSPP